MLIELFYEKNVFNSFVLTSRWDKLKMNKNCISCFSYKTCLQKQGWKFMSLNAHGACYWDIMLEQKCIFENNICQVNLLISKNNES